MTNDTTVISQQDPSRLDLLARIAELESEVRELRATGEALENENQRLKAMNDDFADRIIIAQSTIASQSNEIEGLLCEIENLEGMIHDANDFIGGE